MEIDRTGYDLILNSLLNKGTAFSEEERETFFLHGLLPPHIATLEEQRDRAYEALHRTAEPIGQYVSLRSLQDSNETLFYSLLLHHIEELMPIVYTPTVGEGCIRFSHLFRRPRGVFVAYPGRDKIDQMLAHPRFDSVEVIVVSDGERILGLGDQGAGGMGIPIGKLCLYTACAGIAPDRTLPILLDVGTDNEDLLSDPLYIGWKHPRIRGEEYDAFVDQFVEAVKKRFPHVLLQWEDFAQPNAAPILERYRDKLCTFNDDIQGTAVVVVGTLLSAVQVAGQSLKDQRIVVVGAGGAGCGISRLIKQAMIAEGMSPEEAASRFYLVDRDGLLLDEMENLLPFQKEFAQPRAWEGGTALLDVVQHVKPTLLVGVCGQPGIFSEEAVREMASHVDRPIIFPLSNPTSRSEATPSDLMSWTDGKVIMGTGSPFDPIERDGKPFRVDQTNNAYIFPGLGLGVTAVQAERVTEEMFMVAAKKLAECSPAKRDPSANLLPPLSQIREVSFKIAIAVAEVAKPELSKGEIETRVLDKMWEPVYVPYEHRV
jgi:malate dehydrogenase (oxaloacetate-decarboxylating)